MKSNIIKRSESRTNYDDRMNDERLLTFVVEAI